MMKWSLERKWITAGFSLVLLLMGMVSYASYQNAIRLIASAAQVRHTNEVLKTLTSIVAALTDAEAGRRGYILFGDEEELTRYNLAIQSVHPKITHLKQLLVADSEQQQKLNQLDILITQRLSLYRHSTELYRSNQPIAAQASLIQQIKNNKQELRQIVAEIQAKEEELLQTQLVQSQAGFQIRISIELLGTSFTFILLLGVYGLIYRQMVQRQKAEMMQRSLAQEKELSELKLRFFSMVSHEFRTPLSIILGSAQLLEDTQQGEEAKKLRNLNRIQSSAKLMTKLLTDILTLTRAEAGKLEYQPELIDLESFCLNLIEDLQSINQLNHSIQFVVKGCCAHAVLDEKSLYSILHNLLSNAMKYSPQSTEIFLILNADSDKVEFQVIDQGIGIPSEDLQALYQPFHRSSNVGKIIGTGLGLAVVKKCVEMHQGQIEVESHVGRGTIFTVTIPQRDRLQS